MPGQVTEEWFVPITADQQIIVDFMVERSTILISLDKINKENA